MATDIVFAKKTGSGAANFTLFGTRDKGVAGGNYVWLKLSSTSPSPWQKIVYAGHDGADVKFMGARSDLHVIDGYVMDSADGEASILAAAKTLRTKNNFGIIWAVTIGGVSLGSGVGFSIDDIITEGLGEQGPRWPFRIALTDLGS